MVGLRGEVEKAEGGVGFGFSEKGGVLARLELWKEWIHRVEVFAELVEGVRGDGARLLLL